jgi:hypothetical protein
MTTLLLIVANLVLVGVFARLLWRRELLGFAQGGKWYLTWISIGVITLMDELTSVFYAPAEAHRFIGTQAIFFIAFTSILMRVLSSRMVEISQILERNGIRGGGVYSFSYLVLGPVASFVAVASIMVDYILTACISTVSAVINGTAFLPLSAGTEYGLILVIIWSVAVLNIIGIRENARVTFSIFIAASFVFVNLIALGLIHLDPQSPGIIADSALSVRQGLEHHGFAHFVSVITVGVASCVLAYSGIESVIQTAGLVQSWRDIAKAYWFLALTVGIVTPVVSALALSAPAIDLKAHEGDLITYYATLVGNVPFGVLVGVFGSIILIMAVNTAYVASSELLERVAHRYRVDWLIETNRRASLYRIHIVNASLYTSIILLTRGSQAVLAEMYAVGLLASFCLNVGCLLVYRYFKGTKEIPDYYTSRVGTALLEFVLVACFIYLALHKPYGTGLWASVVTVILLAGIPLSRRYGPEVKQKRRSDYPMEMLLALGETDGPIHVWFRRPGEGELSEDPATVFVTFFSPRQEMPEKLGPNHYRFAVQGGSVYRSIAVVLDLLVEELGGRDITVHFGWPTSSWLDRMSTGVLVHNLMRLPPKYPALHFSMECAAAPAPVEESRRAALLS